MKKITLAVVTVAIAACTGCSTFQRLGVGDDAVVAGVQAALVKHGLADTVTDAQIKEVVAIIQAETRLQEIGEEVGQQQVVQDKINEVVTKYLVRE
jgi:predicted nucleic acid-binding protein